MQIPDEHTFLFDLQGYIILRGVLSQTECDEILGVLRDLESREYEDTWMEAVGGTGRPTKEERKENQIRLNGLPRLDPVFDRLIAHERVVPYLKEWMGEPQLINTWSISCTPTRSPWKQHSTRLPIRPTSRPSSISKEA